MRDQLHPTFPDVRCWICHIKTDKEFDKNNHLTETSHKKKRTHSAQNWFYTCFPNESVSEASTPIKLPICLRATVSQSPEVLAWITRNPPPPPPVSPLHTGPHFYPLTRFYAQRSAALQYSLGYSNTLKLIYTAISPNKTPSP